MSLNGKNVLVTGGAGFIGSALVRELLKENANVIVYDNMLTGDESNLTDIKNSIEVINGDILDTTLEKTLYRNSIDYVFNLAAEPYIPHCYRRPRKFFEVNANGALNVLLASQKASVERILQYSTSEVYGTAKYVPMDENHPVNPLSTYAVSKLAADRLCFTLHHEQKLPVIILRQFNVYGPRETQPYIIPELIAQISRSNKLRLGNIKARRDFTYVDDAARAAVALIKRREAEGQVFNCGTGKDYSIEELARIIAELTGKNSIEIQISPERLRPLDVEQLQCNYFKLYKLTGWEPTTSIVEGLKETINWFSQHGEKWIWETKIVPEEKMWKPNNRG